MYLVAGLWAVLGGFYIAAGGFTFLAMTNGPRTRAPRCRVCAPLIP